VAAAAAGEPLALGCWCSTATWDMLRRGGGLRLQALSRLFSKEMGCIDSTTTTMGDENEQPEPLSLLRSSEV
jgi:hypothetical protein